MKKILIVLMVLLVCGCSYRQQFEQGLQPFIGKPFVEYIKSTEGLPCERIMYNATTEAYKFPYYYTFDPRKHRESGSCDKWVLVDSATMTVVGGYLQGPGCSKY